MSSKKQWAASRKSKDLFGWLLRPWGLAALSSSESTDFIKKWQLEFMLSQKYIKQFPPKNTWVIKLSYAVYTEALRWESDLPFRSNRPLLTHLMKSGYSMTSSSSVLPSNLGYPVYYIKSLLLQATILCNDLWKVIDLHLKTIFCFVPTTNNA